MYELSFQQNAFRAAHKCESERSLEKVAFFFFFFFFLTSDNLLTVRLLFDAVLDENNDKTWQWREFFAKRLETALSKVILRKDTPQAIWRREISDKLLIYIKGNVRVF